MKFRVPILACACHGIEDAQQFVHASDDGHFFGFAFADEALIEGADDWVEALSCKVPLNSIPVRSYPLFTAREVVRTLLA